MAKKTYKITRFDLGRNSKYDARDIKDGELAEAININVTNPGYISPSGNLQGYWNASDNAVQNHAVGTFETSGTDDTNNTALTAFANASTPFLRASRDSTSKIISFAIFYLYNITCSPKCLSNV